jgi:hypothetical protein
MNFCPDEQEDSSWRFQDAWEATPFTMCLYAFGQRMGDLSTYSSSTSNTTMRSFNTRGASSATTPVPRSAVGSLVAEETSGSRNARSVHGRSLHHLRTPLHVLQEYVRLGTGQPERQQLQEDGDAGVKVKCLAREHHAPR